MRTVVALHCFGGEVPLLAGMLFVESLIPIGAPNPLSRWASFGLDLRPPAGAAAAAAALAAAVLAVAVADVICFSVVRQSVGSR